jgi:hypothetical protein
MGEGIRAQSGLAGAVNKKNITLFGVMIFFVCVHVCVGGAGYGGKRSFSFQFSYRPRSFPEI